MVEKAKMSDREKNLIAEVKRLEEKLAVAQKKVKTTGSDSGVYEFLKEIADSKSKFSAEAKELIGE